MSTAGYRVDEVLNGADVTDLPELSAGRPVRRPDAGRRGRLPIVPVTFADHGIEAPDPGFVRVEDRGSIDFLLHLVM
jgi:hypothetical protein